jgi:nucleotide-binding universal stress UspA family protein
MYTRLLVPLDGSKTAEKVLPYAPFLAARLKLPVELLEVIDIVEIARLLTPEKAHYLNTVVENRIRSSEQYLRAVAGTFPAVDVRCTVEKGTAAEGIIERAAGGQKHPYQHGHALVARASNGGYWGVLQKRFCGGATNPLLLIRATEEAKTEGEANLRSVIVPLDGSELAESVLPTMAELAKKLKLKVILFRAYTIPTPFP